jgi:hypothetical protein
VYENSYEPARGVYGDDVMSYWPACRALSFLPAKRTKDEENAETQTLSGSVCSGLNIDNNKQTAQVRI